MTVQHEEQPLDFSQGHKFKDTPPARISQVHCFNCIYCDFRSFIQSCNSLYVKHEGLLKTPPLWYELCYLKRKIVEPVVMIELLYWYSLYSTGIPDQLVDAMNAYLLGSSLYRSMFKSVICWWLVLTSDLSS